MSEINKRFHFDSVCGDTGLIDEEAEIKWWITNVCSVTDLKDNWISACDKLNELASENDVLKQQLKTKYIVNKQYEEKIRLEKENEDLKHKLLQISAKMCFFEDIPVEFEQWFFTEIAEPSDCYDKETLSKITNALLGE